MWASDQGGEIQVNRKLVGHMFVLFVSLVSTEEEEVLWLDSCLKAAMGNRQTLEHLLIEQEGACTLMKGICHLCSNVNIFIEKDIKSLHAQARWF